MKVFQCQNCQAPVFFENTSCLNCGHHLGYHSGYAQLLPLRAQGNGWNVIPEDGQLYQYCANFAHKVCNWLVPDDGQAGFCEACQLNKTIPNLEVQDNVLAWYQLEKAKHRLVYGLQRLGLPIISKTEDPERGLAFDFLSPDADDTQQVQTGHLNGLITINLAEADSVHREWIRRKMSEPYRTLIGHFRHEVGHYYWDLLVFPQENALTSFRNLFGDETRDYGEALEAYYQQGAPSDWQENYISSYASAHAWEDWAETWAHYLHIMDTVETGFTFGLSLHPQKAGPELFEKQTMLDPYSEADFTNIVEAFVPLTFAINSFNRGMGISDIYPFVIAPGVQQKLTFIHDLVFSHKNSSNQPAG
ncbi:zinc-binding metallopeptidase family protein [Flavilitoribacter nigricans]|uniref:Zinc-ribbon domain-containing protein n=1 Tax=Flavilitoribacter nigricans (strain ATCC 23147 / DSM 23189 / NBRC 102662 / NCIMB 1420 / SS-2) TaxID=1122177 RepID=A0A2D0MYF3_FLAN2|nr:putative zinc-binding peptidase [Flavilitoribacter nigricans]PHN01210.1 hypothetical protein CRP01_38365 [Flavilitoribacter nigricans DSM 23189 = NBRC 102662]